ncbi:MAG: APC family permease, partial [Micromonosporaceae bacterium]
MGSTPAVGLQKTITVRHGVALAVSLVIGSGLLGLPGVALAESGVHATAVGWLLVVAVAAPMVAIFSRLGLRLQSAAGLAAYAELAVGRWGAWAVGTVMAGTFGIGLPALALIGASYLGQLLGTPSGMIPWLAIGILAAATVANLFGVRATNMINTASLVALVVVVLVIVVLKMSLLGTGAETAVRSVQGAGSFSYVEVWQVCALLFWAFLGWEGLSFGLEEFRDPHRSIPLVYWLSFVLVIALYLALGLTAIGAQVAGVDVTGASGLARLLATTPVGDALVVIMVLVILANANAWVFGASRMVYAGGRDGMLPAYLARLSRRGAPVAGLLTLLTLSSAVLVAVQFTETFSLSRLILIASQNLIVLYVFCVLAYWKTERGWPRWPVTAGAVVSVAFLLSGFSGWIAYPL